jgi:hypothetical protein
MYEKKKILVEKAFDQAKNELSKNGKSPRAAYINSLFEEKFGFAKNEKMFIRYYSDLVEKNKDRYIDGITLNQLSQYIGFKDYDDFCNTTDFTEVNQKSAFTKVSVSIDDKNDATKDKPNFIINISTNPIFKLQEFLTKQSGIGFIGMLLVGGIFVGKDFINKPKEKFDTPTSKTLVGIEDNSFGKNDSVVDGANDIEEKKIPSNQIIRVETPKEKPLEKLPQYYMYWNGERFIATAEANLGGQFEVVPMDENQLKYFRKVTRLDTITDDNYQKFWYSKHQNKVEFFTLDGRNPGNGKGLNEVSKRIFEKYILNRNNQNN